MLFISPPFGNYLNIPQTMSIKGSFTIEERPGLLLLIINYYSERGIQMGESGV